MLSLRRLSTSTLPLVAAAMTGVANSAETTDARPNILLVMVDDLGFADLGCYGSEIQTPHIDALAAGGLRFSQFYNTGKCHSSRISLLTGQYSRYAGESDMRNATTVARLLAGAGYATSMTGKWHLDGEPTDYGFGRFWGHLSGATDFFAGDDTFRLDGEPWDAFGDGFYTTDANVDFTIEFLDEAIAGDRPFFHYIAFNAPHYPLQAPLEDIRKYLGAYDVGWGEIRQQRFEKQKGLGLFPRETALPPLPAHVPEWDSLDPSRREFESFRMAVFAAMVDRIDQQMGRLVGYLRDKRVLDNTVILICSDNGACPFERSKNLDKPPWEPGSYYLYDASWATVGNTPFKHYKQTQHEGGIASPLIVHWPGKIPQPGGWTDAVSHLIDILPSCVELAGASYPTDQAINPPHGRSLVPAINGGPGFVSGHDELFFAFSNCRALRQGDWKIASFYQHRWELYDVSEDRLEQTDLAAEFPERVAAMAGRWTEIARGAGMKSKKDIGPVKADPAPDTWPTWHKADVHQAWSLPAGLEAGG